MSIVALDGALAKVPRWAVAVQLARHEGSRLVRHPVFIAGTVFSLAMFGLLTWQSAPVLHRDDVFVGGSLLPLAAATLIIANLATSRAARNSTDELYKGTVTSTASRTVAQLLSLAFPIAASMGVVGVMFVYMLMDSPVGTPRIAEVLVGPVCVGLFGGIGIALGRWKPHPALGPMAVVALAAIETLLIQPIVSWQGTGGQTGPGPWVAPWVPMGLTGEVPSELVIRPTAWHLLFLLGIGLLFAAVALARDERGARVGALLAAGMAGIVMGSIGQFTPPTDSQRAALAALIENPEDHQVCEERAGVTYCAYPAYAGWIDRWAVPVEGALRLIPPDARPEGLVVRQKFGAYFEGPTDLPISTARAAERDLRRAQRLGTSGPTFYTSTRWGRGETEGVYEIGLALHVAMTALDFPESRDEMVLSRAVVEELRETLLPTVPTRSQGELKRNLVAGKRQSYCYTSGQARALAAWWIAGQATPGTRAAVSRTSKENPYGLTIYETNGRQIAANYGSYVPLYPMAPPPMWDRLGLGGEDFHYAAALLEKPTDEVTTILHDRWTELSEASTTTESVLDDFELESHPTLDAQIAALPDDVELEQGHRRWTDTEYPGGIPCL